MCVCVCTHCACALDAGFPLRNKLLPLFVKTTLKDAACKEEEEGVFFSLSSENYETLRAEAAAGGEGAADDATSIRTPGAGGT